MGEEVEEKAKRYEEMLQCWDRARATLISGDRSDLPRTQIEEAFDAYEEIIESLRASLTRVEEESSERMRRACLAAIENKRLQECTGDEGDVAYETALDDVEQNIKTICLSRPIATETERSE